VRVVGGELRSRRLGRPPEGVRPTSDRVRESLFGRLGDVRGCRVLDLFAGTGALAIEALSRGAEMAVLVDRSARSLNAVRENLEALGLTTRAQVIRGDAAKVARRLKGAAPFDLVFLDPPYDSDQVVPALDALVEAGLLAADATVVVESPKRHSLAPVAGLSVRDERTYGDTRLTWLVPTSRRAEGDAEPMSGTDGKKRVALFAASFDPLTNGHLDLIRRTRRTFDEVIVAVAENVDKKGGTFTAAERLEILQEVLAEEPDVRVESFSGLVVDFAEEIGATAIIRGLRAMSDFEYEFEMALMNRHLKPEIEILFMMTSLECLYVSSSRLKELAHFGADIDEFVPPLVAKQLREKLRRR
jgi:pantetheine-phosphate adenylyltransferase